MKPGDMTMTDLRPRTASIDWIVSISAPSVVRFLAVARTYASAARLWTNGSSRPAVLPLFSGLGPSSF